MFTYSTPDGRIVRSHAPIHWLTTSGDADTKNMPNGEGSLFDLISAETAEILSLASDNRWLSSAIASNATKISIENYCIAFGDVILICDGKRYRHIDEFLNNAEIEEKKVIVTRIALQISASHTILSIEASHHDDADHLTPGSEKIINDFFVDRCLAAQERYAAFTANNELAKNLCISKNNTIFVNTKGGYVTLRKILEKISPDTINELVRSLAETASRLHQIILGDAA